MTTKTLLAGILLVGLTTASFANSSSANLHQSCRNGSIATFKMTKGTVYADFNGKNRKRFECASGMCTKSHVISGMKGLSSHQVTGTSRIIKKHSVKCR